MHLSKKFGNTVNEIKFYTNKIIKLKKPIQGRQCKGIDFLLFHPQLQKWEKFFQEKFQPIFFY